MNYLNHDNYNNIFEVQILLSDTAECQLFKRHYFDFPISIIRFKVQSYHKASSFNQDGYRGLMVFTPIVSFDLIRKYQLRLINDWPISDVDKIDFYFKNTIRGWFCACKNGSRVLSSCANILAALAHHKIFSRQNTFPLLPKTFPNH